MDAANKLRIMNGLRAQGFSGKDALDLIYLVERGQAGPATIAQYNRADQATRQPAPVQRPAPVQQARANYSPNIFYDRDALAQSYAYPVENTYPQPEGVQEVIDPATGLLNENLGYKVRPEYQAYSNANNPGNAALQQSLARVHQYANEDYLQQEQQRLQREWLDDINENSRYPYPTQPPVKPAEPMEKPVPDIDWSGYDKTRLPLDYFNKLHEYEQQMAAMDAYQRQLAAYNEGQQGAQKYARNQLASVMQRDADIIQSAYGPDIFQRLNRDELTQGYF